MNFHYAEKAYDAYVIRNESTTLSTVNDRRYSYVSATPRSKRLVLIMRLSLTIRHS